MGDREGLGVTRRLGTREESWLAVLNRVIRAGIVGQTMEGGGVGGWSGGIWERERPMQRRKGGNK